MAPQFGTPASAMKCSNRQSEGQGKREKDIQTEEGIHGDNEKRVENAEWSITEEMKRTAESASESQRKITISKKQRQTEKRDTGRDVKNINLQASQTFIRRASMPDNKPASNPSTRQTDKPLT